MVAHCELGDAEVDQLFGALADSTRPRPTRQPLSHLFSQEPDRPVTDVTTDPQSLTMALTAEFPVPVERLRLAFTDPRQLERFWGPPDDADDVRV